MRLSRRRWLALAIFVVPWVFWVYAISNAISRGFFEDQLAVQAMVLGGAVSMVAATVAELW